MEVVKLTGIKKTFEQKKKTIVALDGLDLTVEKGEFVTIMGPSGCGKSIITKLIAGLETNDEGTIEIFGEDCSKGVSKDIKKRIGYVFQNHNLAEWRTVLDNVYLPLEQFEGKKDATWEERADKYLGLVGLKEYKTVFPNELSGGMKQRVGIARAMVNEPELLVLDDPFGALDAITRKMLAASISRTIREQNKTVIMVTSNVDEAIQYSDVIYVMTNSPGKVYEAVHTDVLKEERYQLGFWNIEKNLEKKRYVVDMIAKIRGDKEADAE